MNVSSQLKHSLISRIEKSEDLDFLKALQTIFDSTEKELFPLTAEQKIALEESRIQIKNGNVHDNDEVMSELREWLRRK